VTTAPKGTVYVIDDDPSLRRSLVRLFASVGLAVETFPSAVAFLAAGPVGRPGCLVVDLRMPGPSGLELQRRLAAAGDPMPVLFVTGHATVSMAVRAMKAGALDVLTKPFDEQDLLDAVQRALAQDRAAGRERTETDRLRRRHRSLTPRQREVLALVTGGMSNKQVAATLGIAEKTVKIHRGLAMKRMGARTFAALVRMVERLNGAAEARRAEEIGSDSGRP
jgi:FixJ family two-component response regulator